MNIKHHITASFLGLTQAIPAQAQEEGPYPVTVECAVESLQAVFGENVEIIIDANQDAIGGLVEHGDTVQSAMVVRDKGGMISFVNVQSTQSDADSAVFVYNRIAYDSLSPEFWAQSGYRNADNKAIDSALIGIKRDLYDLDTKLRECSGPMLLG